MCLLQTTQFFFHLPKDHVSHDFQMRLDICLDHVACQRSSNQNIGDHQSTYRYHSRASYHPDIILDKTFHHSIYIYPYLPYYFLSIGLRNISHRARSIFLCRIFCFPSILLNILSHHSIDKYLCHVCDQSYIHLRTWMYLPMSQHQYHVTNHLSKNLSILHR